MCFEKETVAASGHGSAGESWDHFPLSTRRDASRQLHAVRRIINHWRSQRLHNRNRPHVVHQPAIAKRRSPLGQHDTPIAGRLTFFNSMDHVLGGDELGFLDIHNAAMAGGGLCRSDDQVGLLRPKMQDL